ncbi:uncharacterized protein LOC119338744 [Triticum dicoccoides]|uniref:uncharacterized protein LOC119338744 n=1 Tax=Triticum dicoccoides TaxID=85692 RepID=UPI001891E14C|nr:uncharacterized protein LOC119338744 [Triticum dicoccoides]
MNTLTLSLTTRSLSPTALAVSDPDRSPSHRPVARQPVATLSLSLVSSSPQSCSSPPITLATRLPLIGERCYFYQLGCSIRGGGARSVLEQREEEAKVEIVVREGELGETAAGSEARLLHLPQGGGDLRLASEKKGPTAGVIRRFLRVGGGGLWFRRKGDTFKVLQVADMHYEDGRSTACEDVLPEQVAGCSDLNTTAFLYRVIRAENPDLVVFTVHYSRCWAVASSRRTTTTPVQTKVSIQEKNIQVLFL